MMDDDYTTLHGKEMLDEFVSAFYSEGRKYSFTSWHGVAILTQKPTEDELKKLNIPTLVFHGDKDKLLDFANDEALANLIPNAKLITSKGGGPMFPLLDMCNDKYIDDMINHFQSG